MKRSLEELITLNKEESSNRSKFTSKSPSNGEDKPKSSQQHPYYSVEPKNRKQYAQQRKVKISDSGSSYRSNSI